MSTEGVMLRDGNSVAASDLSTKQFCAVKQTTTSMTVDLASTGGEAIAGILQNNPKATQAADYAFAGQPRAMVGSGGVTAGDLLQTEAATGKLITQSSTNVVVAIAKETGAANSIIRVQLTGAAK